MSVAFTFGSFGDIVAIVQLAWQLRAVLDKATGARAEIRTLVADIDAFVVALQDIQRAIERRRKTLRPDVINGIASALARCRDTLRTIHQKIKRTETQLSGSTWQKYWGDTAWGIKFSVCMLHCADTERDLCSSHLSNIFRPLPS